MNMGAKLRGGGAAYPYLGQGHTFIIIILFEQKYADIYGKIDQPKEGN